MICSVFRPMFRQFNQGYCLSHRKIKPSGVGKGGVGGGKGCYLTGERGRKHAGLIVD